MKIQFVKLSDDQHELCITRGDGSKECRRLETRSYLLHDLTHLAFELEARTSMGFWGQLANGKSLSQLSDHATEGGMDLPTLEIEKTVAVLQGLAKTKTVEAVVESVAQQRDNFSELQLEWFTAAFVRRVEERLKAYLGRWRATKYRDVMEVRWHFYPGPG